MQPYFAVKAKAHGMPVDIHHFYAFWVSRRSLEKEEYLDNGYLYEL